MQDYRSDRNDIQFITPCRLNNIRQTLLRKFVKDSDYRYHHHLLQIFIMLSMLAIAIAATSGTVTLQITLHANPNADRVIYKVSPVTYTEY